MRRIGENAWLLLPQLGVRHYNKLCSELKGRSFLGRTLLSTSSGDGTYLPNLNISERNQCHCECGRRWDMIRRKMKIEYTNSKHQVEPSYLAWNVVIGFIRRSRAA
jgi:hypothetical protein